MVADLAHFIRLAGPAGANAQTTQQPITGLRFSNASSSSSGGSEDSDGDMAWRNGVALEAIADFHEYKPNGSVTPQASGRLYSGG